MAKFPAMPLWTDAYLADCGHLNDAETGRYLMILIYLWRAPKQRFPNNDEWLAHKFKRSIEDVQREIRPLIKEFCKSTGNWISQGRLSREFSYVLKKSKNQSVRSKARWDKEKDLTRGNAPTPTPLKEEREDKSSPKKTPKSVFTDLLGLDLATAVVEHRQRLGSPLTVRAAEMLLRQLEQYHDPPAGAEEMLARGWRGFKVAWMDDLPKRRNNGDGKTARKVELAIRLDRHGRDANGGVADEGGRRAARPLLGGTG